ncbi:hypothetical protein LBMAG12_18710 [Actinomycetes bacterium]|nr:hypothetical protein LBMAG12_18710 [Actinomycetes bacterium]
MTAKKPSAPPQPETAPVRIWVLLDSSGSMESLQLNVVESLNAFVAEQAATDPATAISIHTFPSVPYARKAAGVITVLVDDVAAGSLVSFTPDDYSPNGNTPLYDSLGELLRRAETDNNKRISQGLPCQDPLVVIITDGQENASRWHHRKSVFEHIERLQADGWAFIFLGSNQEAWTEAAKIGITRGDSLTFESSPTGLRDALSTASKSVSEYRTMTRPLRSEKRNSMMHIFEPSDR